jgi:hypothetical protein
MIGIENTVYISGETLVDKFEDDPEEFSFFLDALQDNVPSSLVNEAAGHMTKDQAEQIVDCLQSMVKEIEEHFDMER